MKPTEEQAKIIEIASKMLPTDVLTVQAYAGCGKTSTLVRITETLSDKKFLYLAFNKSIVQECKSKFGKNVNVATTHALAYRRIVSSYKPEGGGKIEVRDDYKPAEIMEMYKTKIDTAVEVIELLHEFCSGHLDVIGGFGAARKIAVDLYNKMKNFEIDITHSFYLKEFQLTKDKQVDGYDYILLDEAQDTNEVTLNIFLSIKGAKILVGDTHQSIYSFRGRSINAIHEVPYTYKCYLTTTFRCCPEIVEYANKVLNTFKREEVKMISRASGEKQSDSFAVICRTNAKIIEILAKNHDYNERHPENKVAYRLIRPADAIFKVALNLYFYLENNFDKIDSSYAWLKNFKSKTELDNYIEKSADLELKANLSLVKRYKGFLFALYEMAKEYHKNKKGDYLITAHVSKGLEFDEIMIMNDFPSLQDLRLSADPSLIEETNLYYVAVTRAKWFLEDKTKNKKVLDRLF